MAGLFYRAGVVQEEGRGAGSGKEGRGMPALSFSFLVSE